MTQDEVDILQERKVDLDLELSRPDLTMAEGLSALDELLAIDGQLRQTDQLQDIADARTCASFGCSL